MFDKAVDACLWTLEFVPDLFVTNKMLEKLCNVALSNYDIKLDDIDPDTAAFFSDGMGIVTIDLNNIDFDNDNFGEDHPINIILLDLLFGVIELNNVKHAKKNKQRITAYRMVSNKNVGWKKMNSYEMIKVIQKKYFNSFGRLSQKQIWWGY